MIPPSVARNVQDRLTFDTFAGKVRTAQEECGRLVLPTGKLVAADAPEIASAKPFKTTFPIDELPVILTVARYEDKDERVAAARVQVAKGTITSWKEADPPMIFVDSGTAAFCDVAVIKKLVDLSMQDRDLFLKRLEKTIDANYRDTRSFANLRISGRSGPNVIACSSGFGDGGYGAYLGYNAKNQLACLLLDFGILLTQEEIDDMAEQEPFEDK